MADDNFIYKLDPSTIPGNTINLNGVGDSISGTQYGLTVDDVNGLIGVALRTQTEKMILAVGAYGSQNFVTGVSGWQIDSVGNAEFNNGIFRGNLSAGSIDIPNATTANSFHVDANGNMWIGATTFAAGTFSVSNTGVLKATAGTIGGFTLTSTTMYGGVIKTAATVGAGSTGVIMDTAGLRGYDSVLGQTFNLPTNGTAPFFSSGVINKTVFNIDTAGVLRTSATVGDGTASSAGVLINNTGIYGVAANQLASAANVRILVDGSAFFSGTFNIGGSVITIGSTGAIQTNLDSVNTAGGGTLYLKSGTYTLTSAGISMYGGVALVGTSASGTIIDMNSTSGVITIAGTFRYSTGTITSITSGVNVTGSGTLWLANVVAGRDQLFINGQWMIIAAVLTNTTLTLAEGYDGATVGAGSAYRISTPIQNVTLSNFTVKNSTGSAITISDARFVTINGVTSQSNNIGISYSYVTEFSMNGVDPILSTSHGISGTNGGRWYWNSVNSVSNGGTGIVLSSVRAVSFTAGAGSSNTLNGFSLTSCTDVTLSVFSAEFNGAKGYELVSGDTSCTFTDGGVRGNASDGAKFTASATKCYINGGTYENNTGWGINIADNTSSANTIFAPNFANNTAGNISDLNTPITVTNATTIINTGGAFNLNVGGDGEAFNIMTNNGTTNGSTGGNLNINLGYGSFTGTANAMGGNFYMQAGDGGLTNGGGGDVSFVAGRATGSGKNGDIYLISGQGIGGSHTEGFIKIRSNIAGGAPYAKLDTSLIASTDKTFTFPNTTGQFKITGMDTMTYAGTITLNTTLADLHKTTTVNATGNATINASTGGVAGQVIRILIVNDGTSGKTITFGTNFSPNGTLVGTTSKKAVVEFVSDGSTLYEVARTLLLT